MVRDTKLGQNPFLEGEDGGDDGDAAHAGGRQRAGGRRGAAGTRRTGQPRTRRRPRHVARVGSTRRAEDGELSAMEMMAVETTLNGHLHEQLTVLPLAQRDLMLAQAIVESLDETATCAPRSTRSPTSCTWTRRRRRPR
ncbi:MAG: hypothetical protein MZW92_69625 [Comamonadaceae bacterium]|nr:hypothetical protein [Comamonadaceae bacterium]